MNITNELFLTLQQTTALHNHETPFYRFMSETCASIINASDFTKVDATPVEFGAFGQICIPYYSMGNIDSLKLFGLDELILFSFYLANKNKYRKVADMGANIGVHSMLMSRLGWQVTAFEPDPVHVNKIKQHLALNHCQNIQISENAIASVNEQLVFTRLKGNRTGSHLKGVKDNVYGEVDEFTVNCLALSQLMTNFDFIKMDIEGAEAKAICATNEADWDNTDMMLEVGSVENAEQIWSHINKLNLRAHAQKVGWARVKCLSDVPTSYKEGSLFISKHNKCHFC